MNTITFVGECPKTFDSRWHSHETWELIYCTSGECTFRFKNGYKLACHTGEVVAIPPKLVHANGSEDGFVNIYLHLFEPSFISPEAFKMKDEGESILNAFISARAYYYSEKNKKELVLSSLGNLIATYIAIFLSESDPLMPIV
jgi:hypothetical protein